MFDQQTLAFDKFSKLKVGALFMAMGTGKTKVAVDLVNYNKVDLLLYFAPYSTKKNIEVELIKWGVNCPYEIVGYETLQSSDKTYLSLLDLVKGKKVFVIADESIFIKNDKTNRFNRILAIRKYCEYALVLNGTPITKTEWDLYNQMEFLSPLIINMNKNEFRQKFFTEIKLKKTLEPERIFYKFSKINSDVLSAMVEPYIFNADLEFNKRENECNNWISVDNTDYQTIKEYYFNQLTNFSNNEKSLIRQMLMKLLNNASCNKIKANALIEYASNKKVIIFCNYVRELQYLAKNMDAYVLYGKSKDRDIVINDFKKGNKPLIMTYGVGSYSLNFQFCNEIVYSSVNFDYGKMEQSKARIKRIGQNKDVKYTYFLADLGINEMVLKNIGRKMHLDEFIKQKVNKGDKQWLKNI